MVEKVCGNMCHVIWKLKMNCLATLPNGAIEQPHQRMDSLLRYKKCSILHILTQKPPTSIFVKMSKYAQYSCKWTVTVYIYMVRAITSACA